MTRFWICSDENLEEYPVSKAGLLIWSIFDFTSMTKLTLSY